MKRQIILQIGAKLLIPPILLFALYVQFHGDYGPGGGFQAGVIFAAAFILYGLVFGPAKLRRAAPLQSLIRLMALGLLIYLGAGYAGMAMGGGFLNYNLLSRDPVQGQHLGIFLIELGVGMTVASTMLAIYTCFAALQSIAPANGGR